MSAARDKYTDQLMAEAKRTGSWSEFVVRKGGAELRRAIDEAMVQEAGALLWEIDQRRWARTDAAVSEQLRLARAEVAELMRLVSDRSWVMWREAQR